MLQITLWSFLFLKSWNEKKDNKDEYKVYFIKQIFEKNSPNSITWNGTSASLKIVFFFHKMKLNQIFLIL